MKTKVSYIAKRLRCCNPHFKLPPGAPDPLETELNPVSADLYTVACITDFDPADVPTTAPDFFHFGPVGTSVGCQCNNCDVGFRFESWADVADRWRREQWPEPKWVHVPGQTPGSPGYWADG